MTSSQHMLVVVGARPQFIKAAALNRALEDDPQWRSTCPRGRVYIWCRCELRRSRRHRACTARQLSKSTRRSTVRRAVSVRSIPYPRRSLRRTTTRDPKNPTCTLHTRSDRSRRRRYLPRTPRMLPRRLHLLARRACPAGMHCTWRRRQPPWRSRTCRVDMACTWHC